MTYLTHLDIKAELLSDLDLDIDEVGPVNLGRQVPGLGDDRVSAVARLAGASLVNCTYSVGLTNSFSVLAK